MPFVIGIEIKLSNNHTCKGVIGRFVDICDDLAGVYPKEFKFVGWHPHCRCFAIAKMEVPRNAMITLTDSKPGKMSATISSVAKSRDCLIISKIGTPTMLTE